MSWKFRLRIQSARFWRKVNKNGPIVKVRLGACWLWTGRLDADGYGQFHVTLPRHPNEPKQKGLRAHRAAWLLDGDDIPEGMEVLHKCDVRACVRRSHLRVGTQADNIRDMVAKGRHPHGLTHGSVTRPERRPRGEANKGGGSKLTTAKVVEMRKRRAAGEPTRSLAHAFGVSNSMAKAVCAGKAWAHVPMVTR